MAANFYQLSQPELRPYGLAGINTEPTSTDPYFVAALARAAAKLDALRISGRNEEPAGTNVWQVAITAVLAVPAALPFVMIGIGMMQSGDDRALGLFPFLIAIGLLLLSLIPYFGTRPTTPKRLLRDYFRSLGKGRYGRARSHVVSTDFDSLERVQPYLGDFGQPTGRPMTFDDRWHYFAYWDQLLRWRPAPYCLTRVSDVAVRMVAPDVAIVEFKLRLIANTRLVYLSILVIGLLAAFIDIATRKTLKARLQKVMVKVGGGWKLLNGEWEGPEERDLSWLAQQNN